MSGSRKFDITLFGATGFTGGLVAEYLAGAAGKGGGLRWALAGRNRQKLEAVRERLRLPTTTQPEIVVVDANDRAAVAELAANTRVVITTVGPYIRYGEPLVAACAKAGTDYVDLTGEPRFVREMIERYHAQAVASGAKIVNACGFDSIPHDLGVLFTIRALERRMPLATLAHTPVQIEGIVRGKGSISGGTWQSALLSMSEPLTRAPEPSLPGRRIRQRSGRFAFRPELGVWSMPLPTIDPEIVCRSAQLLEAYGPDFAYAHYMGFKRLPQMIGMTAGFASVIGLSKLRLTREWLAKLRPSGAGPSAEERAKGYFRVTFLGRAGEQRVRCEVRGGDPGYGETAKMLAESALCLAEDRERLPAQAGVITSAAAFGEVLIERLSRAGIVFEELPLGAPA